MRLVEYAKQEFEVAGWMDGNDEMQNIVMGNIIELLKVFEKQGHSGYSAPYVLTLFNQLARYSPISLLTGGDSEWEEVENEFFQNKRCSSVFKRGKNGEAYTIEGKIFTEDGGETFYNNSDSKVYISFPIAPKELKPKKIYIKE